MQRCRYHTKDRRHCELDFATIEHRLRGLAFLNGGATLLLADERGIEKKEVMLRI
jgi:DNA gyrase/topoisomerase IV subunit B